MANVQQTERNERLSARVAGGDNRETRAEEREHEAQTSMKTLIGGFSLDTAAAAGAVVLSILGLTGIPFEPYFAAISAIAIGTGLLLKSGSVAARFRSLEHETGEGREPEIEMGAGISGEMIAGLGGIALGILALILQPITWTLSAVALITFGGALLLGGGETYRVSHLSAPRIRESAATRYAAESSAGAELLVAIAAVTLGILALAGIAPAVLVLVGFLAIGGAELLAGMSVSGHFLRKLHS